MLLQLTLARASRWFVAVSSLLAVAGCGERYDDLFASDDAGEGPGAGGEDAGADVAIDADPSDGDGSDASEAGDAAAKSCTVQLTTGLVPVDIYLMVDQSGSMSDTLAGGATKWSVTTQAITSYVASAASPSSLGVGVQYFGRPSGDECSSAFYATPEVPIAPLTSTVSFGGQTVTQAQAIGMSLAQHQPTTDTPTYPALQGALEHAQSWQVSHPARKVAVVLATDGDPTSGCGNDDVQGIRALAAAALGGTPSIQTFVVGVGSSYTNLQTIASGGGTNNFFTLDQGPQQFIQAMEQIRGATTGCAFAFTPPSGGGFDPATAVVRFEPGPDPGGTLGQVAFPQVASAFACDPVSGGWFWTASAGVTKVALCPSTCGAVRADASGGHLDLIFGCSGGADGGVEAGDADAPGCGTGKKRCNGFCVDTTNALFGCAGASCAQCASPQNGAATCSAGGACDFECSPGFSKNTFAGTCDPPPPPPSCCTNADCAGAAVKTCIAGYCQAETLPSIVPSCDEAVCDAWCQSGCGGSVGADAGTCSCAPFANLGYQYGCY